MLPCVKIFQPNDADLINYENDMGNSGQQYFIATHGKRRLDPCLKGRAGMF